MLNGIYRKIQKIHARMAVKTTAEIPFQLGMGESENMASIPIISKPVPPEQGVKMPSIKDMTDTQWMGEGAQVQPEDFPKLYWLGGD